MLSLAVHRWIFCWQHYLCFMQRILLYCSLLHAWVSMVIGACFNRSIFIILNTDMTFLGLSQSIYLFMVDRITMTTITTLGAKARVILLQFSPTAITFMELIRWFQCCGYFIIGYKILCNHTNSYVCCFFITGLSLSKEGPPAGNATMTTFHLVVLNKKYCLLGY